MLIDIPQEAINDINKCYYKMRNEEWIRWLKENEKRLKETEMLKYRIWELLMWIINKQSINNIKLLK